nr:sensor domain-containing diguanylate cyclase [Parapusillimonas granuli]
MNAEAGLFTYSTLHPGRATEPGGKRRGEAQDGAGNEHFWKVVSLVPAAALPSAAIGADELTRTVYLAGLALLLVLAAYVAHAVVTQRRLRHAIERSNRRHREITQHLGEGLIVLDRDARVVEANPEAERLLGRSRREMLGLGAAELFRPPGAEPEPAAPHPIQAVAATGRRYRSEDETFRRKDGTAFPVGVTAAPLASDGAPIGAVVSFRDMTDIKAYQEEIRRLAYHDPLTDLPNRRLLLELIRQALKEAERKQAKVGLMFLDLDHFKHVNDVYGHDGGDELLKGVAQRLRQAVRAVDTVSRQGGDEFVILLPGIDDADSAVTVARKILESLQAPLPVLDQLLPVKVSIGIALFPDHGGDVDTLMTLADTAMYEAKQGGRNRYCLAGTAPGTL